MQNTKMCMYYQANVDRPQVWFLTSVLKSWDHTVFDRTISIENSIFEFFVPETMEARFLVLMGLMAHKKVVWNLQKLPNRLADPSSIV